MRVRSNPRLLQLFPFLRWWPQVNRNTLKSDLTAGLVSRDLFDKYGYKFDVTISGTKFEATATPKEYGVTGRLSFFVDESGIVRGADHNGAPANAGWIQLSPELRNPYWGREMQECGTEVKP